LTLIGTVQPDNATNQAIVWSVTDASTTGATIAGNTLSPTAVGTAIVTATIVNGSEPGIDYTQDFEIEVRGFELDPAPPLTTVTAEPGTIANSTRLTNLNYDGAVSYAVCILGDFYAHPNVGDSLPAGVPAYNLGDNITDVTAGTRLGIYALDSDGKVIAFSDPVLAASEIAAAAPPIESFEVLPVVDGVTAITDLSHTDAVSYAVCVRDSAFDTPLVGDSLPGDAVPYYAAEAQLINDVEAGQHLGMYALDSSGKIIAFSDYMLVEDSFVPVSSITGVPTAAFIGHRLTLTGTAEPGNATNRNIEWSIKDDGYTESELEGNTLTAWGDGTVILTATIANGNAPGEDYTQDFEITVTRFNPVDNITGVPTTATVGTPLTLTVRLSRATLPTRLSFGA
jgi:endo-1,4-beta-xylanase